MLRFFGRGSAATGVIENFSRTFAERNLSATRLRLGLPPLYSTLMMSGIVFVIWQGGERVVAGAMSVGAFVGYLALFIRFVERGFRIPQLVNSIQSGGAAYARLEPMLAPALAVAREPRFASFKSGHVAGVGREETASARAPRPVRSARRSTNVTFTYPGATRPALVDFSLEIAPGSLVAVTGPVGSGKSALARALLGIYPIESGKVRCSQRTARRWITRPGVARLPAPGRAPLLGLDPRERPHGGGSRFPGARCAGRADRGARRGRRRISRTASTRRSASSACASPAASGSASAWRGRSRPTRRDPPGLLVLDDPFSAVDVETEARIVAALREAFGPQQPANERVTILLCSQRLAAFPQADRVVVLENGRIEEQGTHDELVARDGLYARIYRAQVRSEPAVAKAEA